MPASDRYIRDGTRIISPQTVTMDTPGKAISSRAPLAKSSYREMRCVCVYVCARNACSRSRARGGVVGGRDGGTLVEKFPRAPQVFRYRTVATVRVPPAAHVSSDAAAVAYRRSSSRHRAIRRPRKRARRYLCRRRA